ncbi:MAG: hypothetical protein RhofKO_37090 [Rhodothermales bacterium]
MLMPHHVFCYGSLMYPSVWRRVVRGRYDQQRVTVHGYQRYALRHASYPGLRSAPEAKVEGVLYLDIRRDDVRRLDAFEGNEYEQITVACITSDGVAHEAFAYLYRARYAHRVLGDVWDAAAFETHHLPCFLTR